MACKHSSSLKNDSSRHTRQAERRTDGQIDRPGEERKEGKRAKKSIYQYMCSVKLTKSISQVISERYPLVVVRSDCSLRIWKTRQSELNQVSFHWLWTCGYCHRSALTLNRCRSIKTLAYILRKRSKPGGSIILNRFNLWTILLTGYNSLWHILSIYYNYD